MSKKQLILIFSVIFILILSGCSKDVKTDLSPAEHVTESILNTFSQGSIDASVKSSIKIDYDEVIKLEENEIIPEEFIEILNKLSLEINYKLKIDEEAKTFNSFADYDINYNLLPLLSIESIISSNELGFGITNFYDKYFVINYSSFFEFLPEDKPLSKIDIKPYLNIIISTKSELHKKISESKKYTNIFVEHLESRLDNGVNEELIYNIGEELFEENVLTYTYQFDLESILELFDKIIKEVENDEDMKNYAKALANEMLDKMIETKDYELFDLSEEEIIAVKEELNTEFESIWTELFSEIKLSFAEAVEELAYARESSALLEDSYENLEVKIYINKNQQLRKINTFVVDKGINYTIDYTVNSTGENVVIESKKDKYINVMQFINFDDISDINDKEELAKIIKEFLLGGINEISEGEVYEELFEDLKPLEEYMGIEVSEIKMYLGMAKAYIENISLDEIITFIDEYLINTYDYDDEYYDYTSDLEPLDKISFVSYKSEVNSELWNIVESISKNYNTVYQGYFTSEESVLNNLKEMIDSGSDIIFIDGEQLNGVVFDFAEKYPLVQFVFFNSEPEYYMDNVITIYYYNHEIAYVAGAVAGLTTETNKIAFVGGINDIYTQNFEVAFKNGVASINPEIIVFSKWVDSNDYDLGEGIAAEIDKENIDVVYHVADEVGNGIIDASINYNFKIIGNETNYGNELPNFISSTMKDYNVVVDYIIADYNYGYIAPYYSFGIYDNALYMLDGNMSDDIIEIKNKLIEDISSYELYIPEYYGDY